MKAIFEDRGNQYTVNEGDIIAIDLIDKKTDEKIEFQNILMLIKDEKTIDVGVPYVKDAKVVAKVINPEEKDDKVIVFKFKRRKNEKRIKGHRQKYTIIRIETISA